MDHLANSGSLAEPDSFRVSWDLAADTSGVAEARQLVRQVLTDWTCDALVDDAQLIVTELVTNAILHTEAGCTVTMRLASDRLRITVTDPGDGSPEPQPFDLTREGGRGLLIVGALSSDWGVRPTDSGTGKTVWAELAP